MRSQEEAARAVAGLNKEVVPHVSEGRDTPLVAAVWSEEAYQALMAKDNMRRYADSMRKASTWYEKHKNTGFHGPAGPIPCRFFALGRGCMFGRNCVYGHDQPPDADSDVPQVIPANSVSVPAVAAFPSAPTDGPEPRVGGMVAPEKQPTNPKELLVRDRRVLSPVLSRTHGGALENDDLNRDLLSGVYVNGGGGTGAMPPPPEQRGSRVAANPVFNGTKELMPPSDHRLDLLQGGTRGGYAVGGRDTRQQSEPENNSHRHSGGNMRRSTSSEADRARYSARRVAQHSRSRSLDKCNHERGPSHGNGPRERVGSDARGRFDDSSGKSSGSARGALRRESGYSRSASRGASRERRRGDEKQGDSGYSRKQDRIDDDRHADDRRRQSSRSSSRQRRQPREGNGRPGRLDTVDRESRRISGESRRDQGGNSRERRRESSAGRAGTHNRYDGESESDVRENRKRTRSNGRVSDRQARLHDRDDQDERGHPISGGRDSRRLVDDDWVHDQGNGAGSEGGSGHRGSLRADDVPRNFEIHDMREGSAEMDDALVEAAYRPPVKTTFTVTARMGALPPPPVATATGPSTRFSVTMPPNLNRALGPRAPHGVGGGAQRGGRRGGGRGGGVTRMERRQHDGEGYNPHGWRHHEVQQ